MEKLVSNVREKRTLRNCLDLFNTVVRYGYFDSGANNHVLELQDFVYAANDTPAGFTSDKILELAILIYDYTDFPSYYDIDCRADISELMEIISQYLQSSFYFD